MIKTSNETLKHFNQYQETYVNTNCIEIKGVFVEATKFKDEEEYIQ